MPKPDKHINPAIECRLAAVITSGGAEAVPPYLATLSCSQLRTAGYLLGEKLMPPMPDADFWHMAAVLVASDSKAFLGTVLKSAASRGFSATAAGFDAFCQQIVANPIDTAKTLARLLPVASHTDIPLLFALLRVDDCSIRVAHLIRVNTMAANYALFATLRQAEDDKELTRRTVAQLMRRADDISYNLASLLVSYFGVNDVGGTFARPVAPWQLGRFDNSYDAFRKAMLR